MNKYMYVGFEEKNGKFRIFLLKETDNGMKPVMAYSEKIGLYYPTMTEKPEWPVGDEVIVKWHGVGKIDSIEKA